MSKILIVDDTSSLLNFLEFVFESHGFAVLKALNGRDALRLVDHERPDVLLVDVMMPDLDGLEVCRRVRANPASASVPILLYSASVGEEIRRQALAAGADEFLGKTLHHAELVGKVRDWLAVRALPGGIGHPAFVELGLDILDLLEVEHCWLLGLNGTGMENLAVVNVHGVQEAQRFIDTVGPGPFPVNQTNPLSRVLTTRRPILNCSLDDLETQYGGKPFIQGLEEVGARAVTVAPLTGPHGERGVILFSSPATLSLDQKTSRATAIAIRYASLSLGRFDDPDRMGREEL
jgi:CheY-like chemotaxis protein